MNTSKSGVTCNLVDEAECLCVSGMKYGSLSFGMYILLQIFLRTFQLKMCAHNTQLTAELNPSSRVPLQKLFSATQKISCISWNPNVYYRVQEILVFAAPPPPTHISFLSN